jgi:hypothetical protein
MRLAASAASTSALLLILALQCFDVRAELLFRIAEQQDGQQRWSEPRDYANPGDTVYPRMLPDGQQVSVDEVQVYLQGEITQRDVYGAKVMESLIKRGRQKLAGNSVSLAGSGGEVDAAMELGRLLRKLRISTVVARGEQCLSSCVFAFMGGDRRTVAGRIGIHRPYFSSTRKVPDRRAYYRQLQKRLQQFIEDLDYPPSLYEAVMAVPPESVSMLSAAELKRFYLQGMSPAAEDEADAAEARRLGISVQAYLQLKAQSPACAGVPGAEGVCAPSAPNAAGSAAADMPQVDASPPPSARGAAVQDRSAGAGPGATPAAAGAPSF